MAGRPPGSQNKDKPFRDALRKQIAEMSGDPKKLERIAEKLLATAENGDIAAIKEVADRLDGKVAQALEHTGADGGPIQTEELSPVDAGRRIGFALANAVQQAKPH